jgi:hypothetical protein
MMSGFILLLLGIVGKGTPFPLVHECGHSFIVDADSVDFSLTFETNGNSAARAVWRQIEPEVVHGSRVPAMIA